MANYLVDIVTDKLYKEGTKRGWIFPTKFMTATNGSQFRKKQIKLLSTN